MAIPQHEDAKHVGAQHVIQKDGTMEMEIVITTGLRLHVLDPEHDKARVDALLQWGQSLLSKIPGATRVIVQQS